MKHILSSITLLLLRTIAFGSDNITIPNTFNSGSTISSSQMNENFNELVNEINNLKLILSGGVKLGSSTNCNSENEGTIRYNTNFKIVELCDGSSWKLSGKK